jgi:hypothetical protein
MIVTIVMRRKCSLHYNHLCCAWIALTSSWDRQDIVTASPGANQPANTGVSILLKPASDAADRHRRHHCPQRPRRPLLEHRPTSPKKGRKDRHDRHARQVYKNLELRKKNSQTHIANHDRPIILSKS